MRDILLITQRYRRRWLGITSSSIIKRCESISAIPVASPGIVADIASLCCPRV